MEVRIAHDPDRIREALALEYRVFHALGFCESNDDQVVDEYSEYLTRSKFFVRHHQGMLAGVLRTIYQSPSSSLPALTEFDIEPAYRWLDGNPQVAEVGILAIDQDHAGIRLAEELYREAWNHDATGGITHWCVVVERWLLDLFRDRYHFTFNICGESREYMGGLCFPAVMSFAEVERHMHSRDPDLYRWFTGRHAPETVDAANNPPV